MWSQKPGSSRTSSPLPSRVAATLCRSTGSRTTGPCCPCRAASGASSSQRRSPCRSRRRRTRGRGRRLFSEALDADRLVRFDLAGAPLACLVSAAIGDRADQLDALVDPPFGALRFRRVLLVDGAETSETRLVSFCENAAKEEEHGLGKRNLQARRRASRIRACRQCPSFWAPPNRSRASYPPGTARTTWARRSPRAERFASFGRRRVRPPPSRGARSQRRR